MKKCHLLLLFVFPLVIQTNAQWTSNTALNTVAKDSIGKEESTPLSVTTSNGNTFISYFALYNGSYQMYLQLLDSNGYRLFGQMGLLVSNQPQSTALYRYDLKVDADDNAILAFQDIRTGGALNIVAYKISMQGTFLWGANGVPLIDPVSTEGLGPTIGITNAGNVVIGWTADAGNNKWVAFQKLDPSGTPVWGSNLRVIDSTATHKYSRQTFAPAGTDDFLMLVADESGFGLPPSKMLAQRYDGSGNKIWANSLQVSINTVPFFFFPVAVSDNQDGFYVGFNTSNAINPSQGDVYMQHVDGSGVLWNPTGNIACSLSNTQKFTPATRYDSFTNTAWVLLKTTDINQGMSGLAIQRFDSAGNAMLGANGSQLVTIAAAYHDPNDFCITDDGVISFYTTGNPPNQTLHAVKNDFTGLLLWGGNPVSICSNNAGKDDLSAGLFVNNQVVAVWDDNRNDNGVYAQNITNSGQLGITVTNIGEINQTGSLMIMPNPVTDELSVTVHPSTEKEWHLKVYDLTGRVVFENEIHSSYCKLKTIGWEKGVYLVRAGNEITKIVKQ